MLELVKDCETLREIQTTQGVTGSLKDRVLADWLLRHNQTKQEYSEVSQPRCVCTLHLKIRSYTQYLCIDIQPDVHTYLSC